MDTLPLDMGGSSLPSWLWGGLALAAGAFVLLAMAVIRKSRLLPGQYVYRASRWSRGNHLLPAQVAITPESITLYQPQWVGKLEESIHMSHISSIKIDTNLVFSNVFIETTGGRNPIVCHGHTKGDAVKMKRVIEQFQSTHFRRD